MVVLDTNVLYPTSLRDLLPRLAEQELFAHVSSARILEEMRSNLVKNGHASSEQAAGVVAAMRAAP